MSKNVVVVGAGVVGLCVALYARQRGYGVTVIDRNPAERDGCSFGNAGMIVPSHFVPLAAPGMVGRGLRWMWDPESPFYIKPRLSLDLLRWGLAFWRASSAEHVRRSAPVLRDLHRASRRCYEELARQLGDCFGLTHHGLLMLCKTAHGLDEEARAAEEARQLGLAANVRDAVQTAALDPDIRLDVAGSVFYPLDSHLSPRHFMAAVQAELERQGVHFEWGARVNGWQRRGRHIDVVRTDRGFIGGDEFVVCAGSWSPLVVRDLGWRLPMQAGKGYSLTLQHPRRMPRIGAICTEARLAVTPMGDSLRFGGTMEMAGLDESISERRVAGIIRSVSQYYPDFCPADFEGVRPWRGLRPCPPDGLPYLGRTGRFDNLILATGHGMMGMSMGPVTGQLVAEIIAGEAPSQDLTLLTPDRFA